MAKVQTGDAPAVHAANGNRTAPTPQPEAPPQRVPPHDANAEEALLASAMISSTALATLVDRVRPDQFYIVRHQQIAGALHAVAAEGQNADFVTVAGRLAQSGIDVPIADLYDLRTPASSNAEQYADLIVSAARRREFIALGHQLSEAGWAGGDASRPLQQLKAVAETAERESAEPLTIRWVDDAVKLPPPEPPVLVQGLMRVGELMVVGAPRAVGKSWLAMNLAALLGQGGGKFLGALDVCEQTRVLISQGEVDEWNTSSRWQMLTGSGGPPPGVAETFDRWRLRVVQRSLVHNGATDRWYDAILDGRLEQTIVDHAFRVLIIDPWAVYYSGAENSNDETEAALDKLRDLAMRCGLAVVIMHHTTGKLGDRESRDPEDQWRGASRLADWASTRVTLLPHYSAQQAKKMGMSRRQARRYQDVFFLRRSTPLDDFSIALDPQTGWWEKWITPEDAAAEANRVTLDLDDVAAACAAAGGEWGSLRAAADSLGMSQQTAKRLLSQAVLRGALEEFTGKRNATGYRLVGEHLDFDIERADEPMPEEPPEEEF